MILLYQIGIFVAIQIAAIFGKKSRNTAIILISIFTVLQVFTSWLLLLQFITIIISYTISENIFFSNQEKKGKNENENTKYILKSIDSKGGRIYREYDLNDDLPIGIREKIERQKSMEKYSKDMYDNDPEHKKLIDNLLDEIFKKK